ncbi:tumor necrosis factor receptor superfamily member 16 [Salvelinus fontinalis]|uniref:tumor necrosis factor receptor superfamily member 16 n=1 Tax=Salvelinus fontinalis TaxID=8038 RepID=UPI0024866344|nr:tumor necrosis factor receptor superfamily member 16 [Salvelinus fontinalis]
MDALWVCTLFLLVKVALGDACVTGQFSQSGECCSPCAPGHGVEVECGMEDTKCKPCPEGTFSPSDGLSPCLPCARCPAGIPELTSCSATQDTHCDCDQHFYLWRDGKSVAGLCAACTVCGRGEGVVRLCGAQGNTQCQPCRPGTFSEEKSDIKPCQACSQCSDTEVEIRACQLNSDTLCMDKKLHILSRPPESDGPLAAPRLPGLGLVNDGEEASPAPGGGAAPSAPGFTPRDDGSSNHILVYVSVLAAVVLGLLLYVAYKCWTSYKQKQALSKARAAELGTCPEGEKLHSDSGVFLDSHSLQDSQPSKGSKRDSKQDSRLYINLPPHRQEEVERLLQEGSGGRRGSWRTLGAALGYEPEQMDLFGHGEAPVHTLLSNWAQQEGSTLGLLCSALARIERPDVAAALTCPAQGVSVV